VSQFTADYGEYASVARCVPADRARYKRVHKQKREVPLPLTPAPLLVQPAGRDARRPPVRFLDAQVAQVDTTGHALTGRALTLAGTKRDTLAGLYRTDPRVAPWAGTAHGVLQAVSTYDQHQATVRGSRAERNSLKTITGDFRAGARLVVLRRPALLRRGPQLGEVGVASIRAIGSASSPMA